MEDWIKQAFENAGKAMSFADELIEPVRIAYEKRADGLMEMVRNRYSAKEVDLFARANLLPISNTRILKDLCRMFFIGGYVQSRIDNIKK